MNADVRRAARLLTAVAFAITAIAAACGGSGESTTASTSTSPTTSAPSTTASSSSGTTAVTSAGPACTEAAISQAITNSGQQVTSVDDFKCGGGWAGANYTTHDITVAVLLRAQGGQWTVVDRGQYCNDPSIPSDVHTYCIVS